MKQRLLPARKPSDFLTKQGAGLPRDVIADVAAIVERVREEGETGLRHYASKFGDCMPEDPLYLNRDDLEAELDALAPADRVRLERIGQRIRDFAVAQMDSLGALAVAVPGGAAGHRVDAVAGAGCYAPGGLYPLPSSVLMTAVTARTAGVGSVWVASPRAAPITLAAAAVAGADGVLAVGGAHAIAALAFGVGPVPASDVIVGPGNVYVTAAKQLLAGEVSIDMLAGPSELVVIADESANPGWVAADLLAQAEHDPQAVPILIAVDAGIAESVEQELSTQLVDLPTADIARVALANGGVVLCSGLGEAVELSDAIAPEHLQLSVAGSADLAGRLSHYGALFVGEGSAEVFGDYGVGPNHVLPTSRTARSRGGLSVLDFLRFRTWIRFADAGPTPELVEDTAWLARQEGLEAHARSAELRAT